MCKFVFDITFQKRQKFSKMLEKPDMRYSIYTLNSDKIISEIWDEMRIKLGCSEDKVWIK
jgi:hypothetical protein